MFRVLTRVDNQVLAKVVRRVVGRFFYRGEPTYFCRLHVFLYAISVHGDVFSFFHGVVVVRKFLSVIVCAGTSHPFNVFRLIVNACGGGFCRELSLRDFLARKSPVRVQRLGVQSSRVCVNIFRSIRDKGAIVFCNSRDNVRDAPIGVFFSTFYNRTIIVCGRCVLRRVSPSSRVR